MTKIPKDPQEIFQEITQDYKHALGNDLLAIILYGSGASGDYVPKKSDLNFLIVLSEEGINSLERCFKVVSQWRKRNVNIPLFLTKEYIESSLDSFPIEFLNMKMNYEVVYGEDVLSPLTFEKRHIRVQCERELKGKLLQLRQGYLDTSQKSGNMQSLIVRSIPAFTAIFRALLHLREKDVPARKEQIISQTCDEFQLNHDVFKTLLNVRDKEKKLSKEEVDSLIHRYITEIRRLSSLVDTLETE
ncbi:MAG: hypothetical protein SVY10_13305 [Thermodesulfobacteriota bacterium]|nr:hypothetical protein [Thermodesulfobacteriota bacterium]